MLRQSVKGLPGAAEALDACGIDTARRAETLGIGEFVAVAREMDRAAELQLSPVMPARAGIPRHS